MISNPENNTLSGLIWQCVVLFCSIYLLFELSSYLFILVTFILQFIESKFKAFVLKSYFGLPKFYHLFYFLVYFLLILQNLRQTLLFILRY